MKKHILYYAWSLAVLTMCSVVSLCQQSLSSVSKRGSTGATNMPQAFTIHEASTGKAERRVGAVGRQANPGEYAPDANTVLLLHMNEPSGAAVSDASTFGSSGTATGTSVVIGRFGNSRSFNGSTDFIQGSSNNMSFSGQNYTLEAWIRTSSSASQAIFTVHNPSAATYSNTGLYIAGGTSGGFFDMDVNNGQGTSTSNFNGRKVNDGQWHHVAGVRSGTVITLYIDGRRDFQKTATQEPKSSTIYRVGQSYPGSFFNGVIDEIRVSNKARQPSEFNLQLPPTNLTATPTGDAISLSWQNGGGAVGLLRYRIYRGTDSTNVTLVDSASSASYTDSGLTQGTTYFYRVSAVDLTGFEGANSYAAYAHISTSANLSAVSPAEVLAGSEFWVDIRIEDPQNASNLFGVSFDLTYTNTAYVDFVSADVSGSFLGTDLLYIISPNDANGTVSMGISRKAPAGGVSGGGTLARVKFCVEYSTPGNETVTFGFSNVSANDPNGAAIELSTGSSITTFLPSVLVWPGDTDANGAVNQGDILPLGLHWGRTGPLRPDASIQWVGQPAHPWVPQAATHADANGDGVVNQADVLPIGLNWGKTHALGKFIVHNPLHLQNSGYNAAETPVLRAIGPLSVTGKTDFDVDVQVGDSANPVPNLFGISFVLDFAESKSVIQAVETTRGPLLGGDVIFFPQVDNANGTVAFGITRKAGAGGVTGSGQLAKVRFTILDQTSILRFSTRDIVANDPNGNPISILPASSSTLVSVGEQQSMPDEFSLSQNYPNPFNPSTTIGFSVAKTSQVELRVLDVLGRNVALLVDGEKQLGIYQVEWKADRLPSGVYLYRLKAGEFVSTKRMLLLK